MRSWLRSLTSVYLWVYTVLHCSLAVRVFWDSIVGSPVGFIIGGCGYVEVGMGRKGLVGSILDEDEIIVVWLDMGNWELDVLGRIFREREVLWSTLGATKDSMVGNFEFDVLWRILKVFKSGTVDSWVLVAVERCWLCKMVTWVESGELIGRGNKAEARRFLSEISFSVSSPVFCFFVLLVGTSSGLHKNINNDDNKFWPRLHLKTPIRSF